MKRLLVLAAALLLQSMATGTAADAYTHYSFNDSDATFAGTGWVSRDQQIRIYIKAPTTPGVTFSYIVQGLGSIQSRTYGQPDLLYATYSASTAISGGIPATGVTLTNQTWSQVKVGAGEWTNLREITFEKKTFTNNNFAPPSTLAYTDIYLDGNPPPGNTVEVRFFHVSKCASPDPLTFTCGAQTATATPNSGTHEAPSSPGYASHTFTVTDTSNKLCTIKTSAGAVLWQGNFFAPPMPPTQTVGNPSLVTIACDEPLPPPTTETTTDGTTGETTTTTTGTTPPQTAGPTAGGGTTTTTDTSTTPGTDPAGNPLPGSATGYKDQSTQYTGTANPAGDAIAKQDIYDAFKQALKDAGASSGAGLGATGPQAGGGAMFADPSLDDPTTEIAAALDGIEASRTGLIASAQSKFGLNPLASLPTSFSGGPSGLTFFSILGTTGAVDFNSSVATSLFGTMRACALFAMSILFGIGMIYTVRRYV